jgi:DNA modification methylase
MEYKKVYTSDSKEFISKFKEYEFDVIFADPPYALGSEVIIRKDGKVDYAKARIKHYTENEYVEIPLFEI